MSTTETIKRGYDISKYNKCPDVADFVIIRGGYGRNHIDPKFFKHYNKCKELNIPYGVYWFSYAITTKDSINEANNVIELIDRLDYKPLYPIYYDYEYDSDRYVWQKTRISNTPQHICEQTEAFCNTLEKAGFYAGYYTNLDYWNRIYKNMENQKYTMWYARYDGIEAFNNMPHKNIHIKQWYNKPLDRDISKRDFPNIIKTHKLNGWK